MSKFFLLNQTFLLFLFKIIFCHSCLFDSILCCNYILIFCHDVILISLENMIYMTIHELFNFEANSIFRFYLLCDQIYLVNLVTQLDILFSRCCAILAMPTFSLPENYTALIKCTIEEDLTKTNALIKHIWNEKQITLTLYWGSCLPHSLPPTILWKEKKRNQCGLTSVIKNLRHNK